MTFPSMILCLVNFSLIGLLPCMFFKRGQLHARWFLTAWPFFVMPGIVVLGWLGWMDVWLEPDSTLQTALNGLAVGCAAISILVIGLTIGCHRVPLALWQQNDDAPQGIVTWGPYRFVRHPFYSAFLLAFVGATLIVLHPISMILTGYALVVLTINARREEARLSAGEFGEDYRKYAANVGRFIPRLGGSRVSKDDLSI